PPATLSCNTCSSPSAKPVSTTTYTLVVSNTNNCTDTASITIYVSPRCADEKTIFIPNIFSPNGDGKNDVLKLEGTGISNIYFAIYNRWGNLIFETHNQSRGWDGTQRGNPCEAGTYVYYLRATCSKTNSEVSLKGNVSLIR
ncbi:MAG: gliding motility-associated C-terminal domain-containing protein, partial [Bacteroidia bacterium]|nr:gliding motility-associated C-terminal domain-containing protein [Bacteroidia bacterium]